MRVDDLDFPYPERLVATERKASSRIMWVEGGEPRELGGVSELVKQFRAGDLLVINDTRVLRRRVFSEQGLEILFLSSDETGTEWDVLCPASRWKANTKQTLAGGYAKAMAGANTSGDTFGDSDPVIELELLSRGRPQKLKASRPLTETFFELYGELPLPPYIQKARGERHNRGEDRADYQTAWAEHGGSLAAPTASLHFSKQDLQELKAKGVHVAQVTLHVGLGTFLPVTVDNLDDHIMHAEIAAIEPTTWQLVQATKHAGGRVWGLGTTVTRTLESAAVGKLNATDGGGFIGETDLFIRPGFEYQVVDVLMTNFHQPRSTLISLVAAFAGLENVKRCYAWAIEREFRLFSYGDLSIWTK